MILKTATSLNVFFVSVARSISLFAVSSGLSDLKLFVPHKIIFPSGLSSRLHLVDCGTRESFDRCFGMRDLSIDILSPNLFNHGITQN